MLFTLLNLLFALLLFYYSTSPGLSSSFGFRVFRVFSWPSFIFSRLVRIELFLVKRRCLSRAFLTDSSSFTLTSIPDLNISLDRYAV